jgi:hypothetical protein
VTRIASNRALAPRKRSFAKAKPASTEVSTTLTVTAPATIVEFNKPVRSLTSVSAVARSKLSMKDDPGVIGGGVSLIAS